jgi:hypothetical protein
LNDVFIYVFAPHLESEDENIADIDIDEAAAPAEIDILATI